MNTIQPHQSWQGQYDPKAPCTDQIRKPLIGMALDQLEKQLSELNDQWGRCSKKISPVVAPFPASPSPDCCNEKPPEIGPELAARINSISRTAKNICDAIRETTNQIEL